MVTAEQIALMQEWAKAKATAQQWADYELQLRQQIAAQFGAAGDGSRTTDVGNGYKLGVVKSTRYTVDNTAEMRALVDKFIAFRDTEEVGTKLLKWKPSLSVSAYRKLPDWGRVYFDKFVTTTPNLPAIEIKGPQ